MTATADPRKSLQGHPAGSILPLGETVLDLIGIQLGLRRGRAFGRVTR